MSVTECEISHVISMRTDIQMIRIYAKRIVALMANLKAIWNCTFVDFPCRTMRTDVCPALSNDPKRVGVLSRWLSFGASPKPASRDISFPLGVKAHLEKLCLCAKSAIVGLSIRNVLSKSSIAWTAKPIVFGWSIA